MIAFTMLLVYCSQLAPTIEGSARVSAWSSFEGTDSTGGVILSERSLLLDMTVPLPPPTWTGYIAAGSRIQGGKLEVVTNAAQGGPPADWKERRGLRPKDIEEVDLIDATQRTILIKAKASRTWRIHYGARSSRLHVSGARGWLFGQCAVSPNGKVVASWDPYGPEPIILYRMPGLQKVASEYPWSRIAVLLTPISALQVTDRGEVLFMTNVSWLAPWDYEGVPEIADTPRNERMPYPEPTALVCFNPATGEYQTLMVFKPAGDVMGLYDMEWLPERPRWQCICARSNGDVLVVWNGRIFLIPSGSVDPNWPQAPTESDRPPQSRPSDSRATPRATNTTPTTGSRR
jgi:hypothetical protein